jgi:hypothetical protein
MMTVMGASTSGDDPDDSWAVEVKHQRGAITTAMVDRFLRSAGVIEQVHSVKFARRWIVATRGIRKDALIRIRTADALASGLRQLERIERAVAEPIGTREGNRE